MHLKASLIGDSSSACCTGLNCDISQYITTASGSCNLLYTVKQEPTRSERTSSLYGLTQTANHLFSRAGVTT